MKELTKTNGGMCVGLFWQEAKGPLCLQLITGKNGFPQRVIENKVVNRPSLALTGYLKFFESGRLQYFGVREMAYILDLPKSEQFKIFEKFYALGVPCFVITGKISLPSDLIHFLENLNFPIFSTSLSSLDFFREATSVLEEHFSPKTTIEGTLVDIQGSGVLIQGLPCIHRTTCVLSLIEHGYSLVADGVVHVGRHHSGNLIGKSSSLNAGFLELENLGIVKISDLFGIRAIKDESTIDYVVRFKENTENPSIHESQQSQIFPILGRTLPVITLPKHAFLEAHRLIEMIMLLQRRSKFGNGYLTELKQRLIRYIIDEDK